ncbi:MAG: serine hydrolase [Lachnospiraceae bacterium]|nr:serine hydrolase [Lachnospiraceae bacterium]
MLKEQIAVIDLLKNLIRGNTEEFSRVTYTPQKPSFWTYGEPAEGFRGEDSFSEERKEGWRLPRRTPESQGISSGRLAAFFEELANDERTDLHHVAVLRHGAVIAEASVAPYRKGMWHASYSMCKTITGMAVGMLIEEGRLALDDKVFALLDKKSLLTGKKNLTVEHLLTMSSGVSFNETGMVSGDDWVSGYLQAGVKGTPGKQFEYNSMNTYILSAIITKITGETLMEYLKPRLWEPLGITQVFWETCPKGITKGGWGLFIRTEDAAKLGQLVLQKGNWRGSQLVPERWLEDAVTKHMETPESMGPYGYGYQVWLGGRPGSCTFNGMLGQNVLVYPDLDMVIAVNAGSDELFQTCVLLKIVRKYFEEDYWPEEGMAPEDSAGYRRLCEVQERLARDGGFWRNGSAGKTGIRGRSEVGGNRLRSRLKGAGGQMGSWNGCGGGRGRWGVRNRNGRKLQYLEEERMKRLLDGRIYRMEQTHVGLCPLMFQVFHNNYTDGIRTIAFYYEKKRFYLAVEEGEILKRMEVGFGQAAVTEVLFHGEPYLLGVTGSFLEDEEGRPVLKLDLAFLEEAVRRRLKCYFLEQEGKIELHWDETPGSRLITEGLGSLLGDSLKNGFMDLVREKAGVDLPALLVDRTIHPVVTGIAADLLTCSPPAE